MDNSNEEWRDIDEFKGFYQVSNRGRVRSVERIINGRLRKSKIIKTNKHKFDQNHVQLFVDKKRFNRSVAKLVALTFIGKPPQDARQIRHKDGNNANDNVDNLEWRVCKGFYAPVNKIARKLYFDDAEKMINSFIKSTGIRNTFNCGWFDIDDFKIECLWRIWKDIDTYEDSFSFCTFCWNRCRNIFKHMYKKKITHNENNLSIESLLSESREFDYIDFLTYYEPIFFK